MVGKRVFQEDPKPEGTGGEEQGKTNVEKESGDPAFKRELRNSLLLVDRILKMGKDSHSLSSSDKV